MSGSNHIVGGIVFTGIYLSMSDVNIFSSPYFLFFTALFAVLPDVDHIKSFIGKIFYPIAKYLNRKFGHRTITHSLIFYVILGLIISAIEQITNHTSYITSIYYWSYGSHLIFDMVTKQGIPLFYPFKKNPCVIPANPYYRLKSSDVKTELMIFLMFLMLGFTCKNLYAHGFWNTYNKTFDNIQHIYAETKLYNKVIQLKYNYYDAGKQFKGEGFIISATNDNILLFDKGFHTIDNSKRIINLFPVRTTKDLLLNEINFANISFDSLQNLVKNKWIADIKIQSYLPINFSKENQPQSATNFSLQNQFNPVFQSFNIDSIDENTQKNIADAELQLQSKKLELMNFQQKKQKVFNEFKNVQNNLNNPDLAERESAIKNYEKAKADTENLSAPIDETNNISMQLSFLKSKLHIKKMQSINGYISYYTLK